MKVNNINVKNLSYLDHLYYSQETPQNPFPFPILPKIKRSVEFFSGNLCFQDGYLSMEQLCLVDCSTCSWDFIRYLEWWGLEVHPHPWAEMWALPMAWTSDCAGHPHQERGNCCAFQSVQWREQGSKARDSHFKQTYNDKLKQSFSFSFFFLPILMVTVFKHFCLLLKFPLIFDFCYYLEWLWFWKLYLLVLLIFLALYKQEEPNSLLFTCQSLGRKQQHNWNLVLKCVSVWRCV